MNEEVRAEHRTPMTETSSESITALLQQKEQQLEGTKETLNSVQGQLQGATAEIEAIRTQVAERDATMGDLQRTLSLTQGQLAEKGALADANEQELTTLRDQLGEKDRLLTNATETMTEAIARYKALAVAANPTVPEEMITGQSIADIDASLETAKGLVTKVRSQLQEEAKATPVPTGAPARTGPPDLSGLSPREKIQYAIQKEEK